MNELTRELMDAIGVEVGDSLWELGEGEITLRMFALPDDLWHASLLYRGNSQARFPDIKTFNELIGLVEDHLGVIAAREFVAKNQTLGNSKHGSVDSPSNYTPDDIECINAIRLALSPGEFAGFCKGTAFRHMWRAVHKDELIRDLGKSNWHLNHLVAVRESSES